MSNTETRTVPAADCPICEREDDHAHELVDILSDDYKATQEASIRAAFEDGREWGRIEAGRSQIINLIQHYRQNVAECDKQKANPKAGHLTGADLEERATRYREMLAEHTAELVSLSAQSAALVAKYADKAGETG